MSRIVEEIVEETKIEGARNLIMMNVLSYEQIAQATGLSLETVQQLAEELKATVVQ